MSVLIILFVILFMLAISSNAGLDMNGGLTWTDVDYIQRHYEDKIERATGLHMNK